MSLYFHKVVIKGVPSLNNRHQHWSKTSRERKEWHEKVRRAFKFKPGAPVDRCMIRVVRFSSRQPDYDNLVYSFKPVFDGLTEAGIILDDNMNVVIERKYSWCKVKRGEEMIEIEVTEL